MPMTRSGTNSAPELPHQREVDRNMFKEFNDLADKIEELSISSKACWCRNQAHMFKKIGNINLINISSSVFRSSPELGYSFPLLGSRCNSISTIFLEYSTVATFDGHHMLTDLTDPSACNYEEGVCVSQTSTIVWDVVPKGARFQYEIIGNTVAKIKYNHIILEEYKVAINFSTKNTSNIPCINIIGTHWLGNEAAVSFPQLNSSTHTVYLIQSNSEILQRFRSLTREKRFLPWSKLIINNIAREDNKVRAKLGNVTMAYGAANFSHHPHLQYPYNHLQTALNHRFDSIYQHLCETENNIIAQYVALLKVDPTLAVRAILNRNDISAQWQGEVIALHKCIRISPTEIYYDGKLDMGQKYILLYQAVKI
uniref:Galectin n=1 Tax=Heterorhabditis bacteriophora TaxID=37862 RepID=A0A1I7WYP9_HETBA